MPQTKANANPDIHLGHHIGPSHPSLMPIYEDAILNSVLDRLSEHYECTLIFPYEAE